MNKRKITWRSLDDRRKELKLSVEEVCKKLKISLGRYGDYMSEPDSAANKLLADYMTFLEYNEVKYGIAELIRIQNIIELKKLNMTLFWQGFNRSAHQIRDQITNDREVSFDQVVRAYGALGYEVIVRDISGTKVRKIHCEEFEYFKGAERERNDKQFRL